jgi:hypothetical protein
MENPDEGTDWDPDRELGFLEQWFLFEATACGSIFYSEEALEWEKKLADPQVEEPWRRRRRGDLS